MSVAGSELVRDAPLRAAPTTPQMRERLTRLGPYLLVAVAAFSLRAVNLSQSWEVHVDEVTYLRVPGGPYIRDDSGVFPGYTVPNFYDPMISKLSVWAPTRREAIERARRALGEYVVKGITTNVRYLKGILSHPEFIAGDYDTSFLTREHETLQGKEDPQLTEAALLASVVYAYQRDQKRAKTLTQTPSGGGKGGISAWRLSSRRR